tara:strand:+ start:1906 stop:2292 length:387 start_codon:yes stop_codon:yes gene_type:complete
MSDLFTIKFDANPSPWFSTFVEISFSKSKLQAVVDEIITECSDREYYKNSYNYDKHVNKVIEKHWDKKCGNIRPYLKALHTMITSQMPQAPRSWHNGHVAAARTLESKIAWSTPGFVEARAYNDLYGG